jgi:hypothetical protein
MKQIVFNLSLLAGVVLVGAGVGLEFGLGFGLLAAGVLVVAITVHLARHVGVKAKS